MTAAFPANLLEESHLHEAGEGFASTGLKQREVDVVRVRDRGVELTRDVRSDLHPQHPGLANRRVECPGASCNGLRGAAEEPAGNFD